MFTPISALLTLVVLAALIAAACGDDAPKPSEPQAEAAQAEPAQPEQAEEPDEPQAQAEAADGAANEAAEDAHAQTPAEQEEPPDPEQAGQEAAEPPIASAASAEPEPESDAEPNRIAIGDDRPATLLLPSEADEPLPLVMLLHGYTMNAESIDRFFGISGRVEMDRFALIVPDGIENPAGDRFWNATPQCCDFYGQQIDDVEYLSGLIAQARNHAAFDRLYLIGYSNGGYMSYRLACEGLPGLTALVSLAGSSFIESDRCLSPAPVSVLQIHGDRDQLVSYESKLSQPPGAADLVLRWAERAGCDTDAVVELDPIDLDGLVSGAETTVQRIREGCVDGITVELWTMEGVGHVPRLTPAVFAERVLAWLLNDARGPAES